MFGQNLLAQAFNVGFVFMLWNIRPEMDARFMDMSRTIGKPETDWEYLYELFTYIGTFLRFLCVSGSKSSATLPYIIL